jgi:hypothetical protein
VELSRVQGWCQSGVLMLGAHHANWLITPADTVAKARQPVAFSFLRVCTYSSKPYIAWYGRERVAQPLSIYLCFPASAVDRIAFDLQNFDAPGQSRDSSHTMVFSIIVRLLSELSLFERKMQRKMQRAGQSNPTSNRPDKTSPAPHVHAPKDSKSKPPICCVTLVDGNRTETGRSVHTDRDHSLYVRVH